MSAIPTFAVECARSGRWIRALMALQGGAIDSTDSATRLACVTVAQVAAAHSWSAALALLHPRDAVDHIHAICKTLDVVARQPQLSITHFETAVCGMLRALQAAATDETGAASSQQRLFLSATQWCSWETASRLLAALPPLSPATPVCAARVGQLAALRRRVLEDVGPFGAWAAAGRGEERDYRRSFKSPRREGGGQRSAGLLRSASPSSPSSRRTPRAAPGETDAAAGGPSIMEQLLRLEVASPHASHHPPQRYTARDRRELSRLYERQRQVLLQRLRAEEQAQVRRALTAVAPAVEDVCAALRVITRPTPALHDEAARDVLPSTAAAAASVLQLARTSRLTPELSLLYARAVGLLCPHRWADALSVLSCAEEQREGNGRLDEELQCCVRMWLMSRGSWGAALTALAEASASQATTTSLAVDMTVRTALPSNALHRLFPRVSRPWFRLYPDAAQSVTRQIAAALACGVRADEVQLSVAGKQWAAQGRWLSALQLYQRFPLSEFQKYATRAMVEARPALFQPHVTATKARKMPQDGSFSAMAALGVLVPRDGVRYAVDVPARPAPPLDVFPACLLLDAAPDWSAALEVFRGCIRTGTRCNPQLLSALLRHADWPPEELRRVLLQYPAATNDGVRRRAKEAFGVELS